MKTSSTGKCVIASLNLRDLNICIFHWRYACQKSTSPSFVILLNLTNKMFLSIYLFCLNLSLSFSVDSLHLSRASLQRGTEATQNTASANFNWLPSCSQHCSQSVLFLTHATTCIVRDAQFHFQWLQELQNDLQFGGRGVCFRYLMLLVS